LLLTNGITSAIQAPFIIDGQALDDQSITMSWRDNSTEAEWFIIQRMTEVGTPFAVDTVDKTFSAFTDKGLLPNTKYSYSIKAGGANSISAESNAIQVTTLPKTNRCGVPVVSPAYIENGNIVKIDFYDSCNIELSYQLVRSHNFGSFQIIGEQKDTLQLFTGWRTFYDSAINPDEWYIYKVIAITSNDSAASEQETVYTHKNYHLCHGLDITKRSTFSTHPAGWAEIVGDSLYVLENTGTKGLAAAVINVADPSNPTFMKYLYPDSIPHSLSNSTIPALFRLGGSNGLNNQNRILFTTRDCITSQSDTLLRYSHDGQQLLKTIVCPMKITDIIGTISDSILVLQGAKDTGADAGNYFLIAYSFSQPEPSLISIMPMGHYNIWDKYYFGSIFGNKLYFESWSCHPTCADGGISYFHMYDYSLDPRNPLHYKVRKQYGLGRPQISIDSCVGLQCFIQNDSINIRAIDPRNSFSSFNNYLSVFNDKIGINILSLKVVTDTAHNRLFVIYPESGSIYSYGFVQVRFGIDSDKMAHFSFPVRIHHILHQGYIRILFDKASSWNVNIFDLTGRRMSTLSGTGKNALWKYDEGTGKRVLPGVYIMHIKTRNTAYSTKITIPQ
jgi:hypothetical protein